ncbi:hypothetical protein EDC04DRAFT_2897703 [Pisolithus marmoratus]|nr:hypothetical protein EDC04DRAFT_2897703 [Pisolithus marmoratus]
MVASPSVEKLFLASRVFERAGYKRRDEEVLPAPRLASPMGVYDQILGPLLIGILFNTYLYGIVTYQYASYYRANFNDRLTVKCVVAFLFVLDTVHSAAVMYMAWEYMVVNYANPTALQFGVWPYPFTPIGTASSALVTHLFLGDRIYRLTQRKVLYAIIITMALPTFGLGMASGIEAWIIHVNADMPRINSLVIAWLSMQVSVDVFLTVTLSIILRRAKTGMPSTDTVLRRLIRGAIQTGLFASIFSLGDLFSFLLLPDANFYGMFAIPIGRIYSNTLLDTLLVREKLKMEMSSSAFERTSRVMGWIPSMKVAPGVAATDLHIEVHRNLQDSTDILSSYDDERKNVPVNPV